MYYNPNWFISFIFPPFYLRKGTKAEWYFQNDRSVAKEVKKRQPLNTVGGNVNSITMYSMLGNF
jgi:hypothetical protein